jgi:acetyltransferase-like isoleucine patch superfamily enzyme
LSQSFLKMLGKSFIEATKPFVQRVAEAYNFRVDRPLTAYGVNPLILEDAVLAQSQIPRTVMFNTGSGTIYVGSNTVFGHDVSVLTGKHMGAAEAKAKGLPQHSVPQGLDIKIGRNCYIGSHAIIVGPLTIGDGAMICAGAVVTQDVPVNAFVAGNPARIFRIMDLIGEEPEQHVQ